MRVTCDGSPSQSIVPGQSLPVRPFWIWRVHGLKGVKMFSEDLTLLGKAKHLKNLNLRDVAYEGSNVDGLSNLENLETLHLGGRHCAFPRTPQSVEMISRFTRLTLLGLVRVPLEDDDLAQLAKLSSLRHLNLTGTQITDQGIQLFTSLSNLVSLTLDGTKVTEEAVLKLQQHLPRCAISTVPEANVD